jgi:hypothetical protein
MPAGPPGGRQSTALPISPGCSGLPRRLEATGWPRHNRHCICRQSSSASSRRCAHGPASAPGSCAIPCSSGLGSRSTSPVAISTLSLASWAGSRGRLARPPAGAPPSLSQFLRAVAWRPAGVWFSVPVVFLGALVIPSICPWDPPYPSVRQVGRDHVGAAQVGAARRHIARRRARSRRRAFIPRQHPERHIGEEAWPRLYNSGSKPRGKHFEWEAVVPVNTC